MSRSYGFIGSIATLWQDVYLPFRLRAPTPEFQDRRGWSMGGAPSLGSRDHPSPRPESRGYEPYGSSALRFARCSLSTGALPRPSIRLRRWLAGGMGTSEERRHCTGLISDGQRKTLWSWSLMTETLRAYARRSCVAIATIRGLGPRTWFERAARGSSIRHVGPCLPRTARRRTDEEWQV